jgi:hypothetical protein
MFVFLVFSRAVCCFESQLQPKLKLSINQGSPSVAPSEAGMRLLLPFHLLLLHQHTATHITHHDNPGHH